MRALAGSAGQADVVDGVEAPWVDLASGAHDVPRLGAPHLYEQHRDRAVPALPLELGHAVAVGAESLEQGRALAGEDPHHIGAVSGAGEGAGRVPRGLCPAEQRAAQPRDEG